jgi:hypothetical protein
MVPLVYKKYYRQRVFDTYRVANAEDPFSPVPLDGSET